MEKYKKTAGLTIKNTREHYNISKKQLSGVADDKKLYDYDIIGVENLKKNLTQEKATLFVKRFNKVFKEKKIGKLMRLSDIYFPEEMMEKDRVKEILYKMEKFSDIETEYRYALEILKNPISLKNEIDLNFGLGNFFFKRRESREAMRRSMTHYEKNLFFHITNKDYEKVDIICRRIAYYYHHLGEIKKAPFLFYAIKNFLSKLENKTVIKLNLAICFEKLNDYEQSLELLKDLDHEFELEGDHQGKIETLLQKGYCLIKLEKYKEAENLYLKMEKSDDINEKEFAKSNRSGLYVHSKEKKKLLKIYDDIREMAIDDINEFNNFDFKDRIIKLFNFSESAYYLKNKKDVLLASEISMKIKIKKVKAMHERSQILLKAIKISNINDLKLIKKITIHISENKKFYNFNHFLYSIIDYYVKNDLENEIKNLFFLLEQER